MAVLVSLTTMANDVALFDYYNHQSFIKHHRSNLARNLKREKTAKGKQKLLDASALLLEQALVDHILPAWYGTKWDFNGTSDTPGEGEVACGYFVAAGLIDIGVKVKRAPLAQQPSSLIIKTFNKTYYREIGTDLKDFLNNLEEKHGEGLYIVGLDNHVGYLHIRDGKRRFIHSNYIIGFRSVMSQDLDEVITVMHFSNWKVAGKLFTNEMIQNWVMEKEFKVQKPN